MIEEEGTEDEDSQINRPSTEDKTATYRRIIFAKRPIDQTLRPISEDFVEKPDDAKVATGNTLRRQLHEDTTKPNPIVEGSNDDHSDVYGGSLSTTRPLFTTSTPPRVLQRVPNRLDRPKIYLNRENLAPARFGNVKYDGSRAFEAETKAPQEERTEPQPVLIRAPVRVPENREYLRQSTEPVYVREQPEQFLRELPAGRVLVPTQRNNIEENPGYRPIDRQSASTSSAESAAFVLNDYRREYSLSDRESSARAGRGPKSGSNAWLHATKTLPEACHLS